MNEVCIYCLHGAPTVDHAPSKVLLDEPYPNGLPTVPACAACNAGFSDDELYTACVLECIKHGTTNPELVERPKIARLLREYPSIQKSIQNSMTKDESGHSLWKPEIQRILRVVKKLAVAHVYHELGVVEGDEPDHIDIWPHDAVAEKDLQNFLNGIESPFFPEIGSRAFIKMAKAMEEGEDCPKMDFWHRIQPKRYEYLVSQANGGSIVRILLNGCFGAEVIWN